MSVGHRFLALALVAGCRSDPALIPQEVIAFPTPRPGVLQSDRVVDRFVQATTPEVDILFVVDDGCSMPDHQDALAQGFPPFLAFFQGSGLDYHIGVTSTDAGLSERAACHSYNPLKGALRSVLGDRWLEEGTAYQENAFQTMVSTGDVGSACPMGLATSFQSLELLADTVNDDFARDHARLHTIVVSDQDDQSEAWGVNLISQGEYENWYAQLKEPEEDRTFSAMVCTEPQGPGTPCLREAVGSRYMEVSEEIGGLVADITADPLVTMEALGAFTAGFQEEYFLSQIPVVHTIDVQIERPTGAVHPIPPEDYVYDEVRNAIAFRAFAPTPLDAVVVRYSVLAGSGAPEELEGQ